MQTKLFSEISKLLSHFPDYWVESELNKVRVIEDLRNYKRELIEKLLSSELLKKTFSLEFDNKVIFKVEELISVIRYKSYWDNSYTKYSNEIGLTQNSRYLKYNTDIIIDFPHKDSLLEGGMTKESQGKQEVYYHKILAKEEIDVLLSPKVLCNLKKYDQNGDYEVSSIDINDNLIIKGNNLIALHSLKNRYLGKIKLIYIDPPYNTGGDSFKYNDRFNHSTWLTFMKNRLEIARSLLSDDGSIWINIDDDEAHYLKVLADEIFGRENFVANIIWQKKYSPQNDAKYFSDMHDHILVFSKNKENLSLNLLPRTVEMNKRYKNPDNDPRGPWKAGDFLVKTYSAEYAYPITTPSGRIVEPPEGRCWRASKEKFLEMVKDNRIWFGPDGNNVPAVKRFLTDVKQGITPTTLWSYSEVSHNQEARREIADLNIGDFSTPKPEKLLHRIISLATNENDIVLDFFMGSGTTQATALKMKRRFIGIEQMDYIENVSVARLKKVISGDQGGISKEVNWMGGGSFIYAELFELNKLYYSKILEVQSEDELQETLTQIIDAAFLDFSIKIEYLTNENTGFSSLSLEEKKKLLAESLDVNQMYLSYSEMRDSQFEIPLSTREFNDSFYNIEKALVKDYE